MRAPRIVFSLLSSSLALAAFGCGDDEATATSTGGPSSGAGASSQGGGSAGGMGGSSTTSTSSGGNGTGGSGSGAGGSGGAPSYAVCNNPPTSYPAGPYGNEVGDTFEPLQLAGWTNPNPDQRINNETFGAYTFDDLRSEHPSSFVVLHLSGMF